MNRVQWQGRKYGRWTVIGTKTRPLNGSPTAREVRCRCECGAVKWVGVGNLHTGMSAQCAKCANARRRNPNAVTRKPLYKNWNNLRRSGRITQRWHDFERFAADVGKRPSPKHALIRPDPTRLIGPDNFAWEVGRNSPSKIYTVRGVTGTAAELCKRFGISRQRITQIMLNQRGLCELCSAPRSAHPSLCDDCYRKQYDGKRGRLGIQCEYQSREDRKRILDELVAYAKANRDQWGRFPPVEHLAKKFGRSKPWVYRALAAETKGIK